MLAADDAEAVVEHRGAHPGSDGRARDLQSTVSAFCVLSVPLREFQHFQESYFEVRSEECNQSPTNQASTMIGVRAQFEANSFSKSIKPGTDISCSWCLTYPLIRPTNPVPPSHLGGCLATPHGHHRRNTCEPQQGAGAGRHNRHKPTCRTAGGQTSRERDQFPGDRTHCNRPDSAHAAETTGPTYCFCETLRMFALLSPLFLVMIT